MDLTIVIPVYQSVQNAVKHLPGVIQELRAKYSDFEIIFIVDNIHINEQARISLEDFESVSVYTLDKNYGQQFATMCGLYLAKGDYIVSIDEDMTQHIVEICNTNEYQKADMLYFCYNKQKMYKAKTRVFFTYLYKNIFLKLFQFSEHSSFRVFSKDLRDKMMLQKHMFFNLDLMIGLATKNIVVRKIDIGDLTDSNSSYNYFKLSKVAFHQFYECNPFIINLVIFFFPALAMYLSDFSLLRTATFYFLGITIATMLFNYFRSNTEDTPDKIKSALKDNPAYIREIVFD